jgi:hypothetical protein
MSHRQFKSRDNAELRAKIDKAKKILPLPDLMRRLDYEEKHIGKTAYCPFHSDEHKSFSVFHSKDGKGWQWKCFAGCGYGDEIAFLVRHFGISGREAIKHYLEMAGFPTRRPSESREYPACPVSPVLPVCPVSPVSEGQTVDGELDKLIKALAAQNAYTEPCDILLDKSFKFARDLKAVQKVLGRKLSVPELRLGFDEWYRMSQPFLNAEQSREDYWTAFLAQFPKIRYATGEGTLAIALENVAKLSIDELPVIPGYSNAPESYRRLAALHRELSRLSAKPTHFLDYRSAAKVFHGMTHQKAHDITHALVLFGVIEIVSNGKSGVNSREAAEFRYLLTDSENGAEEDDGGLEL